MILLAVGLVALIIGFALGMLVEHYSFWRREQWPLIKRSYAALSTAKRIMCHGWHRATIDCDSCGLRWTVPCPYPRKCPNCDYPWPLRCQGDML